MPPIRIRLYAELPTLERGSFRDAAKSCGTQPAYIRMIKRRHRVPSLPVSWKSYKTNKTLNPRERDAIHLLTLTDISEGYIKNKPS